MGFLTRHRLVRLIAGAMALCLATGLALPAQADNPLALAVKAVFVYKFQIYVDWPIAAFPSKAAPLLLCIVGATPVADLIGRAVLGQAHDGHPIVLKRLQALAPDSHCHVAVIGAGDPRFIGAQLNAAADFSTLTITDTTAPVRGMINFVIVDDNVRFTIDERAADRSGLSISSKLMRLAVTAGTG